MEMHHIPMAKGHDASRSAQIFDTWFGSSNGTSGEPDVRFQRVARLTMLNGLSPSAR